MARSYDYENADSATFTRGHVMGIVPVVKAVPVVCDDAEEYLARGQIFMQKHDWSTVRDGTDRRALWEYIGEVGNHVAFRDVLVE